MLPTFVFSGAPYERLVVALELIRVHVKLFTDEEQHQSTIKNGSVNQRKLHARAAEAGNASSFSVIYRYDFVHSEKLTRGLFTTLVCYVISVGSICFVTPLLLLIGVLTLYLIRGIFSRTLTRNLRCIYSFGECVVIINFNVASCCSKQVSRVTCYV